MDTNCPRIDSYYVALKPPKYNTLIHMRIKSQTDPKLLSSLDDEGLWGKN